MRFPEGSLDIYVIFMGHSFVILLEQQLTAMQYISKFIAFENVQIVFRFWDSCIFILQGDQNIFNLGASQVVAFILDSLYVFV